MGSNVPYKVKVLKLVENEVVVYALTWEDALEEARKLPDVAKALEVIYDEEEIDG